MVDFTFESGVVQLSLGEAVVNSLNLQFIDQKTGEPKEQGATKPDIVLRHFTTKPGSVYSLRQAKQVSVLILRCNAPACLCYTSTKLSLDAHGGTVT